MKLKTKIGVPYFLLALSILVFSLLGCELAQNIFQPDAVEPVSTNVVLVTIASPTNTQITSTNCEVIGSVFATSGALQVVVYCSPTNYHSTNSATTMLSSAKMGVFRSKFFLNQGLYYVWAKASDVEGKTANCEAILIEAKVSGTIDETPPVVAVTSHTNHQSVGSAFTLAGTVSDSGGSGVDKVYASINAGAFSAAVVSGGTWSIDREVIATGYYTNSVYAADKSGNVSMTQKVVVYYEPGNVSIQITSPSTGTLTRTSPVTVGGTASADTASITNVALKINGGAYFSSGVTGLASWSKSMTLSQGTNRIQAIAYADNGKSAESSIIIVILDSVVPVLTIATPAENRVLTNVASFTATGSASDATTGIDKVYVIMNGGAPQLATGTSSWTYPMTLVQGSYTLAAYALDKAGNVSLTDTTTFRVTNIDSTKPTVAITSPANGYTSSSSTVTVSGTAGDNVAVQAVYVRVNSGSYATASGTTSWSKSVTLASGANTVYAFSRDTSGNCSATNSITVNYSETSSMTVYFKKPSTWAGAYIHYWPDGTTWASCPAMTSLGNGWYSYTLTGRTTSSLLFKNVAGTNYTYKTSDLSRTGDGWFWTNNQWYDTNPEDASVPALVVNSPSDWRQVSSATLTASCAASGGGGITGVYMSVNGGGYSAMTGASGTYTASASLNLGTNELRFFAVGSSGGYSATNLRRVVRVTSALNPYPGSYTGQLGATLFSDGVLFALHSRSTVSSAVAVTGSFNGWTKTAMTRVTSGTYTDDWYVFVSGATGGDEYKFVVTKSGTDVTVADPYSKFNRYSGGSSVVVDQSAFTWTDSSWNRPGWSYYIVYEMHVKDFTSSSSSGVTTANRGKYTGIIEKLTYLTNLGITAIELMPISEFGDGGYSWGYETCLYMSVESGYAKVPLSGQGGVDEFKQLVNACHNYGIAVILDMVFNHTDNDDNWLWQLDNLLYFDYNNNGVVEAQSGGADSTPWGNRLCTWRDEVKRMGKDTIGYFMTECHVDGFRFDATHTDFMDHGFIRDLKAYASSLDPNVYFVYENLPNQSDLKTYGAQWADNYHDTSKYVLSSCPSGSGSTMSSRIYFNNDDGWAASPVESLNYMESHDESTIAYAMGGLDSGTRTARSRMAAVVLATSLGNPMLWMGQEFLRSREAQNTDEAPLDWTLLTANQSLYNYYAGVFRLRRNNPALRQPTAAYFTWEYTPWSGDPQVIGYSLRSPTSGDKKFVVLVNFDAGSQKTVSLHFPEDGTWTKVVTEAAVDQTGTISVSGGYYSVTIGANSGIIFMK